MKLTIADRIVAFIESNGPASRLALVDGLGHKLNTVSRALYQLRDAGEVFVTGYVQEGAGQPVRLWGIPGEDTPAVSVREQLVAQLGHRPQASRALAKRVGCDESTVRYHMRVLEAEGQVEYLPPKPGVRARLWRLIPAVPAPGR